MNMYLCADIAKSDNMQVMPFREESTPSGSSAWPDLDNKKSQVH
jgi:hypothetical protein